MVLLAAAKKFAAPAPLLKLLAEDHYVPMLEVGVGSEAWQKLEQHKFITEPVTERVLDLVLRSKGALS